MIHLHLLFIFKNNLPYTMDKINLARPTLTFDLSTILEQHIHISR